MAAAAVLKKVVSPLRSSGTAPTQSAPHDDEKEEEEKRFLAQYKDNERPLPPSQIAQDPESKQLGQSSSQLRVEDFELIKTLGTGIALYLHCFFSVKLK